MAREWFRIQNAADAADVYIYGTIGVGWDGEGVAAKAFVDALGAISASRITLHINSLGGDVFEGMAIYSALKQSPAHVTAIVDGIAASAASVIAMAADQVSMMPHAFLMIHRSQGLAMGNVEDMRTMAAELEKVDGSIAGIYADKSGADVQTILAAMQAETWYTANEAISAKLADVVNVATKQERPRAVARADLSRFRRVPAAILALAEEPKPMAKTNDAAPAAAPPAAAPAPEQPKAITGMCVMPDGSTDDMDEMSCSAAGGTWTAPGAESEAAPAAPAAKARRGRAATIAELRAAMPGATSDFLVECLESGRTLAEARDAHMKALADANASLTARVDALEARVAAAPTAAAPVTTPRSDGPADDAKATDARLRAEFADPRVRAEFRDSFDDFKAYRAAEEKGRVLRIAREKAV